LQDPKKSVLVMVIACVGVWSVLELLHVTDLSWPLMLLASAGVGLAAGLALYGLRKAFKF
jgi:predicted membrane channel-forming protein YqfA (hemolysin III family)